jgi:hypothetical protein
MLFREEFQEIVELTSNTLEAFTTAFFLVKDNKLALVAYHSLSSHMTSPLVLNLGEGGVLSLVLEKEAFIANHMDREAYEIPYYAQEEEIKAFMAVQVGNGKGLLCVDTKRRYSFTEKHQKLLQQFSFLMGRLMERARFLRPKLVDSGKYLLLREMLQHLASPPSKTEDLQDAFSRVIQGMGVEEATVLLKRDGKFEMALSHGPLSTERLHSSFPIQNTPWQKVWTTKDPLVQRDPKGVPFMVEMKRDTFTSLLIVPLEEIPGMLGMASKNPRGLSVELLDLVGLLTFLLEPALKKLEEKPAHSKAMTTLDFFQNLEEALTEAQGTESTLLLVGCKVKNLEDIDRRKGIKEAEKTIKRLQEDFTRHLGSPACLFRGHIIMGYKIHHDKKRLEAEGRAMEKNLPLNGGKTEIKVVWKLTPLPNKKGSEELVKNMLKELDTNKRLLGIR